MIARTSRLARPAIVALVTLLAAALAAIPLSGRGVAAQVHGQPDPPDGTGPAAAAAAVDAPVTVTLITGDRVMLLPGDGEEPRAMVLPTRRPGRQADFRTWIDKGEIRVVPSDVAHLVPELLDPELFNVTGLARMGYDDGHTDRLPLIVKHAPGARVASASASAIEAVRALPSIDATAAVLPKTRADDLGRQLAVRQKQSGAQSTQTTAFPGITHVWLDRKLEAAELDWNLEKIGAPAAWDAGFSGEGVTVAVLDTGVDTNHPDLVGQVAAAANFTDDPTEHDGHGHGTHVASVVAGTGAAADGDRKGVAFEADLLSGKVLADNGQGLESWAIAGMHWAADQGADIVNMSLGAPPREGPDPVRDALDQISAAGGPLFVVAAGNSGPGYYTITSPGTASSALTVSATTPDDFLMWGPGYGPTLGEGLIKPDMVAPGLNIVGARAEGTGPPGSEGPYTPMSGTSMATPHVAGAAALLAEAHPDWEPSRLKAALATTAVHRNPFANIYHEGAGQLDLPRTLGASLVAEQANLSFGYLPYPQDDEPRGRPLTLVNDGDEPRTVDLSVELADVISGENAPDGLIAVAPSQLTVPAGGTASTTVTLRHTLGDPGLYTGIVHVRPADGGEPLLRIPVGFEKEPERYDLNLTVLDRRGEPAGDSMVDLLNGDNWENGIHTVELDEQGQATIRVAPGYWSALTQVVTPARGGEAETLTVAGDPEFQVTGDTSLVIDARKGKPVNASIRGRPTRPREVQINYVRGDEEGRTFYPTIFAEPEDVENGRVFLQPTEPVEHGSFALTTRWDLVADDDHPSRPELYELVFEDPTIADPPRYEVGPSDMRDLAELDTTYRSYGGPEGVHEFRVYYTEAVGLSSGLLHRLETPRRRVEMVSTGNVGWIHCLYVPEEPITQLCDPGETTYRPGERRDVEWMRTLHQSPRQIFRNEDLLTVLMGVSDGSHVGPVLDGIERMDIKLWRDGELIGEGPADFGYFPLPAEPGRYTLEQGFELAPERIPVSTTMRTRWTFESARPTGDRGEVPTLLAVEYSPRLDLTNRARSHRPLLIDLAVRPLEGSGGDSEADTASLSVSVDDGRTWHPARTWERGGGSYRAMVPGRLLQPGVHVSLRVSAADRAGNTIDQTVLRAFPVSG